MTRVTNLGRKRTYLEAGFGKVDEERQQEERQDRPDSVAAEVEASPRKKPRKRRRKAKTGTQNDETEISQQLRAGEEVNPTKPGVDQSSHDEQVTKTSSKERKGIKEKAAASERRRQKRTAERNAHTTCLACRQKGHTVKNCPDARVALYEDKPGSGAPGKSIVGICYRCGSTRHNLSRCKKPIDTARSLPFASCFLCSAKGHLASSCPKNEGRGIYPNGGSCKLCGQTSHLAKDCELLTQEKASKGPVILGGTRTEGGADEDDFHVLKRRRDAVLLEEKLSQKGERRPQTVDVKRPPKVVVFR